MWPTHIWHGDISAWKSSNKKIEIGKFVNVELHFSAYHMTNIEHIFFFLISMNTSVSESPFCCSAEDAAAVVDSVSWIRMRIFEGGPRGALPKNAQWKFWPKCQYFFDTHVYISFHLNYGQQHLQSTDTNSHMTYVLLNRLQVGPLGAAEPIPTSGVYQVKMSTLCCWFPTQYCPLVFT